MIAPVLNTERLTLRPYELADYDAYHGFWTSPRAKFMGGPFNDIGTWESFCSEAGQWQIRGYGLWMTALKKDKTPIGIVGFNYPIRYDEPELVWVLFEGYEGAGYAFEAAKVARAYGVASFQIARPISLVSTNNARSASLAERLGAFVEETYQDDDGPCHIYRHPEPEVRT